MPIKPCSENGKPGYRWGRTNKCWTYIPNNEQSKKEAKKKCIRQAIKIEGPEGFQKKVSSDEASAEDIQILLEDTNISITDKIHLNQLLKEKQSQKD